MLLHDSFECFSVIRHKNTIGDQYLSHCFRDLFIPGALNENIGQNHLNIAFLYVF